MHSTSGAPAKLIAWNEDPVHSCYIMFTDKNRFYYSFVNKEDSKDSLVTYTGSYRYAPDQNSGKILLYYKNEIKPAGLTNYLIIESGKQYLFQNFTDGGKKMYLRIKGLGFGRHRRFIDWSKF